MVTVTGGRRFGTVLVALAAIVLPVGCGTGVRPAAAPHPESAASSADGGERDAAGAVRTIDGVTVSVPGGTPRALAFISVGCSDCSAATAALAAAARVVGDRAEFLAVDLDPGLPKQELRSFLATVGADDLPAVIDSKGELLARYQITALSTVVVVDPEGSVTYRAVDPGADEIAAAVAAAS